MKKILEIAALGLQKKNILYFLIYLSGALYWFYFFSNGYSDPGINGWNKENLYLNILREAINTAKIPYYYYPSAFDGNNRFLANPEIITFPHIFLLKYLSNPQFFFIHFLFFYSIGFVGLLFLTKKLNFLSFLFIFIVFNFNGNILNRSHFGFIQYTVGLYLLPFLFLVLTHYKNVAFKISIKLFKEYSFSNFKYPLLMSILLSTLFYNGSFHVALWFSLYLLFIIFFDNKKTFPIILTFFITFMLSLPKVLTAVLFQNSMSGFITGYPSTVAFFDNLLFQNPPQGKYDLGVQGIWNNFEFSMYIGIICFFVFILAFINFNKFKFSHKIFERHYIYAAICIFILSFDSIFNIGNYISSVERIVSRFIIIPFFVALLLGGYFLNYLSSKNHYQLKLFKVLLPFFLLDFIKSSRVLEFVANKCDDCFKMTKTFTDPVLSNLMSSKIISFEDNLIVNKITINVETLYFKFKEKFQIFEYLYKDDFLLKILLKYNLDYYFIPDFYYPKIFNFLSIISIIFIILIVLKFLHIKKK
jgi:hypothetical protein